jgi:hypothetical protein
LPQNIQSDAVLSPVEPTIDRQADGLCLSGAAVQPATNDLLQPVLVAACGRSGSTALMALLSTAPQIAMGREYPFEHRYLTRLAKAATLIDRWSHGFGFSDDQMFNFENNIGADETGRLKEAALLRTCLPRQSKVRETLIRQWRFLTPSLRASAAASLYAEKVPAWMPAQVRRCFPALTLYLLRDPRDVFLSANMFVQRRNNFGFGRGPNDSDLDHARNLTHEYLGFFENHRADCQRQDAALVTYRELVLDPDGVSERLNLLLKTNIAPGAAPSDFLAGHRTSASLDQSLDRWKKERLAPQIAAFFERHLREPMTALRCEFSQPRSDDLLQCDFTQPKAQKFAISQAVASQGSLSPAGADGLRMTITGEDLYFSLPRSEPFAAAAVQEVWMSLSGDVGDHCSVYWRNRDNAFSEERSIHVPHYGGTHWRVVRFPIGKHPQWKGQIAELRVDPLNGERPAAPKTGHLRWVRLVG